ncbi:MAG TPA: hypothetical protein VE913_00730 [Longimicrobium sp.]|nr:hypothetical protein [Longimicrobium sp.]
MGYATRDSTLRILMFDTPGDLPDLKVFYAIEGGRVTLVRARAAEPPAF